MFNVTFDFIFISLNKYSFTISFLKGNMFQLNVSIVSKSNYILKSRTYNQKKQLVRHKYNKDYELIKVKQI